MHLCPAFSRDDLVAAFQSYREQDKDFKTLAATIVAGLAIERSLNYGDYSVPLHDALADMVGLGTDKGLRDFWQPTVELLNLLDKGPCLAIAEPMVERVTFGTWARMKGSEISRQVLQVVTGQHPATRASMAQAAANWVHPLLRFRGNVPAEAADADDMLQAAE
jgi:ParB family chromosome partitioning protein